MVYFGSSSKLSGRVTAALECTAVKEEISGYAGARLGKESVHKAVESGEYTVIVNTTPLGMYPNINACPDIPYDLLTPDHLLYDLLYNPDETLFMKKGKEKGAVVKNGLEMLLLQAFAAWEIWQK